MGSLATLVASNLAAWWPGGNGVWDALLHSGSARHLSRGTSNRSAHTTVAMPSFGIAFRLSWSSTGDLREHARVGRRTAVQYSPLADEQASNRFEPARGCRSVVCLVWRADVCSCKSPVDKYEQRRAAKSEQRTDTRDMQGMSGCEHGLRTPGSVRPDKKRIVQYVDVGNLVPTSISYVFIPEVSVFKALDLLCQHSDVTTHYR
jgi:hypothetical protein